VHSGYENFSGQFFSYGSWNKSVFDVVFARQREDYYQIPTDSNLNDRVASDAEPQLLPQFREQPQVDLCIDIEINCPIELAPIEYLEKNPLNNSESLRNRIIEPIDPAQLQ
jgi:hypothetical protein